MLFVKLLAPVLAAISQTLLITAQFLWHDKRTKRHKRVVAGLQGATIVALIVTAWIVFSEHQAQEQLRTEMNEKVQRIQTTMELQNERIRLLVALIGQPRPNPSQSEVKLDEISNRIIELTRRIDALRVDPALLAQLAQPIVKGKVAETLAKLRVRVARHSALNVPDNYVTSVFRRISQLLQNRDGERDVACGVEVELADKVTGFLGPLHVFSPRDLTQVFAVPADLKIVGSLFFCGGRIAPELGGCTDLTNRTSVVTAPEEDVAAVLWAHEFGHEVGLPHRNETGALMATATTITSASINADECQAFLKAAKQ